jgi:hypothetical protein
MKLKLKKSAKIPAKIAEIVEKACRCNSCGYPLHVVRRRSYHDVVEMNLKDLLLIKFTPHIPRWKLVCSRNSSHNTDGFLSQVSEFELFKFIDENAREISALELEEVR